MFVAPESLRLFHIRVLMGCVALCSMCAAAWPQTTNFSESRAPSPTYWAKPLKGGPARMAAVLPKDGADDAAAFAERFDVRLTNFLFDSAAGEETLAEAALAGALESKIELLVISGVKLAELSEASAAALAARVGEGLRLLWIGFEASGEPELRAFLAKSGLKPVEPAPDFFSPIGAAALSGVRSGYDAAFAFQGPAGRAVELRYWSARPAGHSLVPMAPLDSLNAPGTFENYIALAGRAGLWAARGDPEASIARIEEESPAGPEAINTPPTLPTKFVQRMKEAATPGALREYAVVLDAPAPRAYELRVQVRYPDRDIRSSFEVEERMRKGATSVSLNIPSGAGQFFIDVWLMDGLDVVDWRTEAIGAHAAPELSEIDFGTAVIAPNDRIDLSAKVGPNIRAQVVADSPAPASTFYLRVTDAIGRVVAMRDVPVSARGASLTEKLPIVDVPGNYARLDAFAAPFVDTPLSWWVRAQSDHRFAHAIVRQALPRGLALIVDEPGEGSFAGSKFRRELAQLDEVLIAPGPDAYIGNVIADGVRMVGNLGEVGEVALERGSVTGAMLRHVASQYAGLRPGVYFAAVDDDRPEPEAARLMIEDVVRETDPRAIVGLLRDGLSVPNTGGFVVAAPEPENFPSRAASSADYVAVRVREPFDALSDEYCRWLPWFAALNNANALWVSADDLRGAQSLDSQESARAKLFLAEVARVREGFDVLLQAATDVKLDMQYKVEIGDGDLMTVRAMEFGKATIYAALASPSVKKRPSLRIDAGNDATIYELTAPLPVGGRKVAFRPRAGEVAIAAVLPYEVTRIALDAPASVLAGKRLQVNATVKTKGALPGDHILRMNCFNGAGKRLGVYSRSFVAQDGAGTTYLPLAFNDPPGVYRIVVRDVLSGIEAETRVTVAASPGAAAAPVTASDR